jgi:hypothetical protein
MLTTLQNRSGNFGDEKISFPCRESKQDGSAGHIYYHRNRDFRVNTVLRIEQHALIVQQF